MAIHNFISRVMSWRIHAIHFDPFHLLRTYMLSSAQNGNARWCRDIYVFVHSFIVCVPTKRLLFVNLAIPIKWMSSQRFLRSPSLFLSIFCCSSYVWDICLTLLKIYVQQEYHVPESRLIFIEEENKRRRNNTQYAICTLDEYDWFYDWVRACVRFLSLFFISSDEFYRLWLEMFKFTSDMARDTRMNEWMWMNERSEYS